MKEDLGKAPFSIKVNLLLPGVEDGTHDCLVEEFKEIRISETEI